MSEKENIQLAEEATAAFNAHDLDRYLRLIDESCVREAEIAPEPIRGPQGHRQFLDRLFAAFPDLRLETEQILASGDHVIHRFRATATQKGNFMGMPPTNKRVSWRGCDVVEIRNGKGFEAGFTLTMSRCSSSLVFSHYPKRRPRVVCEFPIEQGETPSQEGGSALKECRPAEHISTASTYHR